ncbi:hypothetical protein HK104_004853, partial [Borealophlyctis nickersoniae]
EKGQRWAWTRWEATVPVKEEGKEGEAVVVCKAVDSSYNVQPETVEGIYNVRGVLNTAWHRVRVKLAGGGGSESSSG